MYGNDQNIKKTHELLFTQLFVRGIVIVLSYHMY